MSLYLAKTRIEASRQHDVVTGQQITQEGQCLVFANDGGIGKVQPSAAAPGQFAGFSISHTMVPTSSVFFADIKADGTTLTLPNTPLAGQIALYHGAQLLTAGTPGTTANEYSISGNTVTLHSGQADAVISVRYRYALTVEQAVQLFGESSMPGDAARYNIYDRIGVITKGIVATDQFDITASWTGGEAVKLGANGTVTNTGGGAAIPGCTVLETPSAGNGGWLVLNIQ